MHKIIMPDLTLNDYRGIPVEELRDILKREARMMFDTDYDVNRPKRKKGPHTVILRYVKNMPRRYFSFLK